MKHSFHMVHKIELAHGAKRVRLLVFAETDAVVVNEAVDPIGEPSHPMVRGANPFHEGVLVECPDGATGATLVEARDGVEFKSVTQTRDNKQLRLALSPSKCFAHIRRTNIFVGYPRRGVWQYWFQAAIVGCKYLVVGHGSPYMDGNLRFDKAKCNFEFSRVDRFELRQLSDVLETRYYHLAAPATTQEKGEPSTSSTSFANILHQTDETDLKLMRTAISELVEQLHWIKENLPFDKDCKSGGTVQVAFRPKQRKWKIFPTQTGDTRLPKYATGSQK